jgi:hypothetical protein
MPSEDAAVQIEDRKSLTANRPALSGWPMILAWLAMMIFAFHTSTHMVGAGDTWVAMACGRHFINHGVNTIEPFSANSHRAGPTEEDIENWPGWARSIADTVGLKTVQYWHPTGWVNQNWLTHYIFYYLTHLSPFADAENLSFNTLVYWKFAVYILTIICVYYTGKIMGVNPALSAVFACFAMFVGRSYFDIRPAGFSNLMVAIFLLILVLTTYRNILYIWLIVPVTAVWCNLHGGYIYVFIMLVPFGALNLLTCLSKKWFVSIGPKGFYHAVGAGFAAFLATIVFNPFHLTNLTHTFVISVSEHAKMWRTVNEWHPGFEWTNPVGTGFPFLVMFILCLGLSVFWLCSRAMLPKYIKAPKYELAQQRKVFLTRSKIFGFSAAIFIAWTLFIGLSFLNLYLPGPDGVYGPNPRGITDDRFDVASFLICAVFVIIVLLSVYRNVHFIWLEIPLILLALALAKDVRGYVGRYIYPFILIPSFVAVHILASLFSKKLKTKPVNIAFVTGTAVAALLVMIVLINPFHFGRLFNLNPRVQSDLGAGVLSKQMRQQFQRNQITLSQAATVTVKQPGRRWLITNPSAGPNANRLKRYTVERDKAKLFVYEYGSPLRYLNDLLDQRRIWVPRYEGKYKVNYNNLFIVLYVVNGALIVLWLLLPYIKEKSGELSNETQSQPDAEPYELPKIDLAMMAIAALTVYMAVRSRRFIPIAGFAACPVLALLIDQTARALSAAGKFHGLAFVTARNSSAQKQRRLIVPPMPQGLRTFFISLGIAAVLGFGSWWGLKFKTVYLDPWPTDPKLTSVFMRMTASDAKPFWALQFVRENKLGGKMFNYWTEGGFIAWGQCPDPSTGMTLLRLFMDGRAQAAYEPKAYRRWSDIMAGGRVASRLLDNAKTRGRKLNADDYTEIGKGIAKQLKRNNVWVVLMPAGQFTSPFVRSLEHNPNWQLIFFNNKQKLFIDTTDPRAQGLFDGIFNGQTEYPDDFTRKLMQAHRLLRPEKTAEDHQKGYDFATEAFGLNPSSAAMQKVLYAARFAELRPKVIKFCREYVDKLEENKDQWSKLDGFHHRVSAGLHAANYLRQMAQRSLNIEDIKTYSARLDQYNKIGKEIVETKRW